MDTLKIVAGKEGENMEGGKRFDLWDEDTNCGMAFNTFNELLDFLSQEAIKRGWA